MPTDYARILPEAARNKRITHLEISLARIRERIKTEPDTEKAERMANRCEEYIIIIDRLKRGLSEKPIYVPIGTSIGV